MPSPQLNLRVPQEHHDILKAVAARLRNDAAFADHLAALLAGVAPPVAFPVADASTLAAIIARLEALEALKDRVAALELRLEQGGAGTAEEEVGETVQRPRKPAVASKAVNDIGVSEGRRKGKPLTDAERAKVRHLIETTDMSNPQIGKEVGITGEKVRHIRDEIRIELAAASGEHYVTIAHGKSADSKPAKLIYSHLDLEPARKSYQHHLPPKPGRSIALWRPDGSLVEFTSGPPVKRQGR
jgi:hypothetical protein